MARTGRTLAVAVAGTCLAAVVVAILCILSRDPEQEFSPDGTEQGGPAATQENDIDEALREAVALIQDRELWPNIEFDGRMVNAFKTIRQARDPRTAEALVAAVDYAAPGDPNVGGGSGWSRPRWQTHIAVPALIQLGEPAVPHILAVLPREITAKTGYAQREYLLLSALGAITGPHEGVRSLEKAIADTRDPQARERLALTLRKFRGFYKVVVWIPETQGGQPYHGLIKEVLQSQQGLKP